MGFSVSQLQQKKKKLQASLEEVEVRYNSVLGTSSVIEKVTGNDLLSIRKQIEEIDEYLTRVSVEDSEDPPRREPFPISPTILVDGIPPRNGIPSNARIIQREDGNFYYVDAEGHVIARNNS